MPRALWLSWGWAVSYERGTPCTAFLGWIEREDLQRWHPFLCSLFLLQVFVIMLRYNLIVGELCSERWAFFWSIGFPWSVPPNNIHHFSIFKTMVSSLESPEQFDVGLVTLVYDRVSGHSLPEP